MKVIEILEREHRALDRALGRLLQIASEVEGGETANVAEANRLVEFFHAFGDDVHHANEEQVLIRALVGLDPRTENAIRHTVLDHERGRRLLHILGESVKKIDLLTEARAWFAQAAREYSELLRRHLFEEEHVLFHIAQDHIDELTDARLASEVKGRAADPAAQAVAREFSDLLE